MKKSLAILLVLVLALSLAACSAPSTDNGATATATEQPSSGNPVVKIGVYEPASATTVPAASRRPSASSMRAP